MKRIVVILIAICFLSASCAQQNQNSVGRGMQKTAAVPGKATQKVGSGVSTVGKAIQPSTGSATGDAIAGAPGTVVDYTGRAVTGTGTVLRGATDSMTTPKSAEAKANLKASVNCSTAQTDIAALEAERRSTLNRIGNGVSSVMPISAAVRLLGGTYQDGLRVASGNYNRDLEAKITQIRTECGVG